MTTQDKLPPLAEQIASLLSFADQMRDHGAASAFKVLLSEAAPYDALIRQQEARIAELEERVEEREADMHARIRAGYDSTVADCWRAKVAELEKERETFRTACAVSNDQAEHVTSLFLPVEAERDQLRAKVAELEAEVERLRSRTHELQETGSKLCAKDQSDLDLFRNAHRRAYEKLSRRLLDSGVGYSRDDHELVTALEAELAPYRELAREAFNAKEIAQACGGVMSSIEHRLAARHKEE